MGLGDPVELVAQGFRQANLSRRGVHARLGVRVQGRAAAQGPPQVLGAAEGGLDQCPSRSGRLLGDRDFPWEGLLISECSVVIGSVVRCS